MISLRRYLQSSEENPFLRMTELLLQAIGMHAVRCGDSDY